MWNFFTVLLLIGASPFVSYIGCQLGTYGVLVGRRKVQQKYPST